MSSREHEQSDDGSSGAMIVGPIGRPMSENDLPPPDTKRWVMRRKAEVVAGVRSGLISLEEACRRYTLSVEEFLSWQRLIDSHGMRGLRATRLQDYRNNEPAAPQRPRVVNGPAE
ncbi:CtrA inhibitor SciP [Azospirillum sp. ST 5-10]|uniref:CtrA inhibitor SciP n=1 Tax=unclassified Azospirillum TaxID=2630922 RepID=UPI003F4A1A40